MIEKYPNGTKTVEETQEYLDSRRYIMRLHIDNDTWFSPRIVTLKESNDVYEMLKKDDNLLWGLSYKDNGKKDCVVKASKIAWISVENSDPVYKEE